MSSRNRALVIVLAVSLGLLLTSCTPPKVGEAPPEQTAREFSGGECLQSAIGSIGHFSVGKASDGEVAGAFDCLGDAFGSFNKYVRGENRTAYTPQEIATFMEKNFLQKNADGSVSRVPVTLQTEFMKIKQIFLGGTRESVTRAELQDLVTLFGTFKGLALKLNPSMKIVLGRWQPATPSPTKDDLDFFEKHNQNIAEVAASFGELLERHGATYRVDDVTTFLAELSSFNGQSWSIAETLGRVLPVAKKVKVAVSGGSPDEIAPTEWKRTAVLVARGYMQYLRSTYFLVEPKNASKTLALDVIARILDDTASVFQEALATKPGGLISRDEILDIANDAAKLFPAIKVSPVLVDQVLKVKQALFGGDAASLSLADFGRVRTKAPQLRETVETLFPYDDIYFEAWNTLETPAPKNLIRFEAARAALAAAGARIGGLVENSFDLREFVVLANEFDRLYPPPAATSPTGASLQLYIPVILQVKKLIDGRDDTILAKETWPLFLSVTTRFYGLVLFSNYFIENQSFQKLETVTALAVMADQGIALVDELLARKSDHVFHRAEALATLQDLQALDWLPESLRADSLGLVLRPLFERILNSPANRLAGAKPDGLTREGLKYAAHEFQIWIETQQFILNGGSGFGFTDIRERIWRKLASGSATAELAQGLKELAGVLNSPVPLVIDARGRLFVSPHARWKYTLKSLVRHNVVRAITRLFIASYAGEQRRIDTGEGVYLKEAATAFQDFRPFALKLRLVEPDDLNFMDNRFRESNIFMPHSDGNDIAKFEELHELVFSIFSGFVLDHGFEEPMVRHCLPGETPEPHSRVTEDCLFRSYDQSLSSVMDTMPGILEYRAKTDTEVFRGFFLNALKGAGWTPDKTSTVRLCDVSLLPHLLQYIELFYRRFDANEDALLDVNEAKLAFPLFRGLLKTLAQKDINSGRLKESELFALFTYILHYGKPPGGIIDGLFRWYPWRDHPERWQLKVDRTQLASILGYIADQLAAQAPTDPGNANAGGSAAADSQP